MSDRGSVREGGTGDSGSSGMGEAGTRSLHPCGGEGGGFEGWWEERSLGEKVVVGIGFGILGAGLIALFGWVVMLLWNWLMPELFGLKPVSYWKAWGLLILCSILFKGLGSGSSGRSDRKRKKHLRRYIREDQAAQAEAPADAPQGAED